MKDTKSIKPKNLILDVDGVLTDGKYYYTSEGKYMKMFGPEDNDALSLIQGKLHIHCVSGDKRGFDISKKRIHDDMHLPIDLVSTYDRVAWIKERYRLEETIYMGDGIYDALVFKEVAYSIAPANAFYKTKEYADYITKNKGGDGAVAEACIHILETFFDEEFDVFKLTFDKGSGNWK